jgi:alanine racemase
VLHTDAVRRNVAAWRAYLGDRPVWAVVKCDAYRLGAAAVARAALEGGAQRLCIVEIEEARCLREAGIRAPIVQVAATPREDFAEAVRLGVVAGIGSWDDACELSRVARQSGATAAAHVAVETGTGWWGIPWREASAFARRVSGLEGIRWEGAWTHIAGKEAMPAQAQRFAVAVAALREGGLEVPIEHAASTGPALWGWPHGPVRLGIGMHGSLLDGGMVREAPELHTAVELRAPVSAVRRFGEPTALGYGGTYTADAGEVIATLRIGYGEGLPKTLSGRGKVLLAGTLCPIVGAIGMNFTMVSLPAGLEVQPGDEATLLGDAPGIRLDDVAAAAQMIPHNVLTTLGAGVPAYAAERAGRA